MGSSASVSGPNIVINTIVAEALDEIATRLEKAKKSGTSKESAAIVRDTMRKHGRIIFNGNNYSKEWVTEAQKRGLPSIRSGVEALGYMANPVAEKLFGKYEVLSKKEIRSRYEIYLESYVKHVGIEARAMVQMVKRQYLPSVIQFTGRLAGAIHQLKAVSVSAKVQKELLEKVNDLLESANDKLEKLESAIARAHRVENLLKRAEAFRDRVTVTMNDLREDIDTLEDRALRALARSQLRGYALQTLTGTLFVPKRISQRVRYAFAF